MKTSPPDFSSGRGCRRAAGRLTHCTGASLSVAANSACHSFSSGWCVRRRRTSTGRQAEIPARHDGGRKHWWRRRFAWRCSGGAPQPDGYTLVLGGTITHIDEVLLKSRRSTTRSRIWTRLRARRRMSSASPCIRQYRLKTSRSTSPTRTPIPASCPTAMPVLARSSIWRASCSNRSRERLISCRCRTAAPVPSHRCPGRTGADGYAGRDGAGDRAPPLRQDAGACCDQSDASCRGTRASDSRRTGVSGCNGNRFLRVARAGRNTQGEYRADRSGDTHRGRRTGLQADADRGGYKNRCGLKSRKIPAVACSRRCSVDAGCIALGIKID